MYYLFKNIIKRLDMDINDIFEKLFNYFQTSTIRELSEKINMSESTVSKWRQRESINAIKKKCRELGIYSEIFSDLSTTTINQGNNGRAGGRDYIENSEKNEINNLIPESILIELNSLYERIKNKDEDFIKNITYEIEDYINEIKRKTRD